MLCLSAWCPVLIVTHSVQVTWLKEGLPSRYSAVRAIKQSNLGKLIMTSYMCTHLAIKLFMIFLLVDKKMSMVKAPAQMWTKREKNLLLLAVKIDMQYCYNTACLIYCVKIEIKNTEITHYLVYSYLCCHLLT